MKIQFKFKDIENKMKGNVNLENYLLNVEGEFYKSPFLKKTFDTPNEINNFLSLIKSSIENLKISLINNNNNAGVFFAITAKEEMAAAFFEIIKKKNKSVGFGKTDYRKCECICTCGQNNEIDKTSRTLKKHPEKEMVTVLATSFICYIVYVFNTLGVENILFQIEDGLFQCIIDKRDFTKCEIEFTPENKEIEVDISEGFHGSVDILNVYSEENHVSEILASFISSFGILKKDINKNLQISINKEIIKRSGLRNKVLYGSPSNKKSERDKFSIQRTMMQMSLMTAIIFSSLQNENDENFLKIIDIFFEFIKSPDEMIKKYNINEILYINEFIE